MQGCGFSEVRVYRNGWNPRSDAPLGEVGRYERRPMAIEFLDAVVWFESGYKRLEP